MTRQPFRLLVKLTSILKVEDLTIFAFNGPNDGSSHTSDSTRLIDKLFCHVEQTTIFIVNVINVI